MLPPAFVKRLGEDAISIACTDGDAKQLVAAVIDDSIVRLRYSADADSDGSDLDRGSIVPLNRAPPSVAARFGRRGGSVVVCTPALHVTIDPAKRCMITATDPMKDSALIVADDAERGGFALEDQRVSIARASSPNERFYGLGLHSAAKIASLDLRGSEIELYNTDAFDALAGGFPPDAPHLYESIPFYIGLHDAIAYGVFTDETRRTRFDLAKNDPSLSRVTAFGGGIRHIDQYIVPGPRFADVLRRYTSLTGRTPLPPPWSIGFHQSRWEGPCEALPPERPFCSAAQILEVAKRFRDEKIPADGLFLDIQHMNGFRTFTFDSARFADPNKLIADLEALGFKTQIIVDPGIKIDPAWETYANGLAGGHFLKRADGTVFEGEVWPGPAVFPDFSAERTRNWWSLIVEKASSAGIRGMWIDMNEPASFIAADKNTVPDDVVIDGNGRGTSTMGELHNAYAFFEAKATYAGMQKARPDERPFVLSRAAFAGQQKYSAVWTGDAPSTWTTLGNTLPELLHLGLSGMTFAGSDVGGYSGRSESTAELFTRWMALGAISPFFRAHAEKDARRQEPWAFGPETRDAARNLIRDRYALIPYLYSAFEESSRTGAPVLRPLVYEFQEDAEAQTIADEAMLGSDLLVAPILTQAASLGRSVYLPKGGGGTRWFDFKSSALMPAGRSTIATGVPTEGLPKDTLQMFARDGAIIAQADHLIDVFPPAATHTQVLYEDDGKASPAIARTTFILTKTEKGMKLEAKREGTLPPPAPLTIRFRRIDHAPAPASVSMPFVRDENDRSITVTATAPFAITIDADLNLEPDGDVNVPLRVVLPPGTPTTTPIHIATSRNGWTHVPITRSGDEATATITMPRGAWTFFKITRGGWPTVEKGEGCIEIGNRSIRGAARETSIEIPRWADSCP